jgi:hypothetical protein
LPAFGSCRSTVAPASAARAPVASLDPSSTTSTSGSTARVPRTTSAIVAAAW